MNVTEAFQRLRLQFCTPPPRGYSRPRLWEEKARAYNQAVGTLEQEIKGLQQTNLTQADRLHKYQQNVATEILDRVRTPGATSEEFRKQPNKRWEGSYTQQVVDALQGTWCNPSGLYGGTRFYAEVKRAQKLLTDYHNTMHVGYEERDSALMARAVQSKASLDLQEQVANLKALLQSAGERQVLLRKERDAEREYNRTTQTQLGDLQQRHTSFRNRVKESMKKALIESGVL